LGGKKKVHLKGNITETEKRNYTRCLDSSAGNPHRGKEEGIEGEISQSTLFRLIFFGRIPTTDGKNGW